MEKKYKVKEYDLKKGFTHGGGFHADDVFSSAFLKILNPEIEIYRGNTVPHDFDGIVYDIGMGKYDHHQKEKEYRENGIPYAAFGLLWREFGSCIFSEEEDIKLFDINFIQPVDLSDNTGEAHELSQLIADFNLSWDEEGDTDNKFEEAVSFARIILENRIKQIKAKRKAKEIVEQIASKQTGKILELDRFYPWKDSLCDTEKLYVIFPSARGGYMIQAVPKSLEDVALKKPFPEAWRGKTAKQLQDLTGIITFSFCHMSGFICAAQTLEDARSIAMLACRADYN